VCRSTAPKAIGVGFFRDPEDGEFAQAIAVAVLAAARPDLLGDLLGLTEFLFAERLAQRQEPGNASAIAR